MTATGNAILATRYLLIYHIINGYGKCYTDNQIFIDLP